MSGILKMDRPLLDLDAMAARMKTKGEIYRGIRDEALAEYNKRHPQPSRYDDRMQTAIRTFAYLCVWDDFHEEGLRRLSSHYLASSAVLGAKDPLLATYGNIIRGEMMWSKTEEDAMRINRDTDVFLATDYPAAFKLMACEFSVRNLANYRYSHNPDPRSPSLQSRSRFIGEWGKYYRGMIRKDLPHDLLFELGNAMQHAAQSDEESVNLVAAEQDRAFMEEAPDHVVRKVLNGNFYVVAAWTARGMGFSDTVSEKGWKEFGARLAKAESILEPLYEQFPHESAISRSMMTVELGQHKGRERMELWFKRAVRADPGNFTNYSSKQWYLQPRWCGSVQEIIDFGKECVETADWDNKLPLILPIALDKASSADACKDPGIWKILEMVFSEYLERYPDSIGYRTLYAKLAHAAGKSDIAREQLKILGEDWDFIVLPHSQYNPIAAELGLK